MAMDELAVFVSCRGCGALISAGDASVDVCLDGARAEAALRLVRAARDGR